MKRFLLRAGLAALALLVILLLAHNLLIKQGARAAVKAALGVEIEIADLDVGMFESRIRIKGLTVHNPEGFGTEPLAVIPLIDVDYELKSLFQRKLHCTAIELNVHELVAVKNARGEINLNRLKAIAEEGREEAPPAPEAPSEPMEMRIDRLTLTIDQVRYVTLAKDGSASTKTIPIGLDHEVLSNLAGPGDIVKALVWKGLKAAGLKGIGVAMDQLQKTLVRKGAEGMEEAVKSGMDKLKDGSKGLWDKLRGK